jgi:hypothetical protein
MVEDMVLKIIASRSPSMALSPYENLPSGPKVISGGQKQTDRLVI